MKFIKNISSDEMIGEFLKAELHSSRFRQGSLRALQMLHLDVSLIEFPDYTDSEQNTQRSNVLRLTRGWPNEYLFTDFPRKCNWAMYSSSKDELLGIYRLKSSIDMTNKERLLSNTAALVLKNIQIPNVDNKLIRQIADRIEEKHELPPIILVSKNIEDKKVLVEGHSRSIAYCISDYEGDIPTIIGTSENINQWTYF